MGATRGWPYNGIRENLTARETVAVNPFCGAVRIKLHRLMLAHGQVLLRRTATALRSVPATVFVAVRPAGRNAVHRRAPSPLLATPARRAAFLFAPPKQETLA